MEKIVEVEEKRKFPRVPSNIPLQFKNLRNQKEPAIDTMTKDLGEGGVRFQSSQFISLARRMIVEIKLPTMSKPIKAISKVAWIKKMPAGSQYEIGNQFLEMTREDKEHVANFVNRLLATAE